MNNHSKIQNSPGILTIRFEDVSAGWDQWILTSSDRHHDNVLCDRELEIKHLQKALERDALILDFGDLFCAMQGKWDKRSRMDNIRKEDVGVNYLDLIVDHAADDYKDYAKNWALLARGNHECAILNHHGTDLTSNLCHRLNVLGGNVYTGGIGGWVRFQFVINKTKHKTINLKYHHGASKNPDAQVTRGVIQTNRQAVYEPDAQIVVNGHSHDAYTVPIARERMSDMGVQYRDLCWFIRTPGYKNEFGDGSVGWANEQQKPPKPLGCIWLHFSYPKGRDDTIIDVECIEELV